MLARNTLHVCDWQELMRGLDDASVDLLLTDPPYNTTQLDFEFELDLALWWQYVKRVMKPNGAVVMTGTQPFTSKLVMSNLAWFRQELIWKKTIPTMFLSANKRIMPIHENILVFSSLGTIYNPQMLEGKAYIKKQKANRAKHYRNSYADSITKNDGNRYPTSVITFSNGNNYTVHPTQKPVDLFRYLIRTYTHEGALVVDPFVGSGTTAAAAHIEGRNFICGDQSAEYIEIARRRVFPEFGKPPKRGKPELPLSDLPLFAGL